MDKIFTVYDKVSKRYDFLSTDVNHQSWIRSNVRYLTQTRPLCDLELYEIGTFNPENGKIEYYKDYVLIDWSDYKYPETKAEQLAPLTKTSEKITKEE